MDSVGFLRKFRKVLSPADALRIIPCLKQDPIIWQSLQDPVFSDKVLNKIGNKPTLWHPAMLALLTLGVDDISESLLADASLPLESSLCQEAIRAYEATLNAPQIPADLHQAGLLALALRERRRLKGTWQGLSNELMAKKDNINIAAVWKTPLACLLAFINDPIDLYHNLLQSSSVDNNGFIRIIIHILSCNPLTDDERLATLVRLLENKPTEDQLNWLELIEQTGNVNQVRELSNLLANSENKTVSIDKEDGANGKDPLADPDILKKIARLDQLASIQRLSGSDELAINSLAKASELSGILQAQLTFKLAQLARHNQDGETSVHALQQVNDLVPASVISRIYLANELINADRVTEAQAYLPQSIDGTYARLTAARIACSIGDKDLTNSLVDDIVNLPIELGNEKRYHQVSIPQITSLIITLLEHELPEQAKAILEFGLQIYPTNLELLSLMIKTDQDTGQVNDAIVASYITTLLQPEEIGHQKQLADLLEQKGDYENAFDERKQIITSSPVPLVTDLIPLANCALKADHPQVAVSISKGILANDPDNGDAILCLGQAYLNLMNIEEAITTLKQAVSISPENPGAWLQLSLAYGKDEDPTNALETLQSAANVIPECADIHLALAQLMLTQRTNSEALPYLKAAYSLDTASKQAALLLSKTLDQLGHVYEADSVLEASRKLHPSNPELALMHGQILANIGRFTEAWNAFQIVLEMPSSNIEGLISYGKTVVALVDAIQAPDSCNPAPYKAIGLVCPLDNNKAIQYVNTAVSMDPVNIEARLLLADLLNANQQYEQALNQYYEVSRFEQAKDMQWNWRIQFGQGLTALKLGHLDAALISLREAAALKPDQIRIQQSLAEAYYQANFHVEALEIAKTVLMLAPQMLDNLIWYSEMMEKLGELPEAINSLEKASLLSPERLDLSLRVARYEHLSGHDELASKVLDQIVNSHLTSCSELQQAASLYFEIGNPNSAIACLEDAVNVNPTASPNLLMSLIKAYEATDNPAAALAVIQRLMEIQPANPELYLQKAGLLIKNDQSEEALACLHEALENPIVDTKSASINTLRFLAASLLRQAGHLFEAMEYIRSGLQQDPQDLELQSFEAELAFSLCLENETQVDDHINASIAITHQGEDNCTNKYPVLNLLCIDSEIALEQADLEATDKVISAAVRLAPEHPRVMSVLSRLALMRNDLDGALKQWEAAVSSYNNIKQDSTSPLPIIIDNDYWSALAIAEASFTLQKWQIALEYYQKAAQLAPYEPKPQLRYVRALTLAAEHQRHCQALMVVTHAPGPTILSDESYQIFCECISRIRTIVDNSETTRWLLRGQAAFKPDLETAKALAEQITDASDAAAVISALLAAGSDLETLLPSEKFQDSPDVLFEIALASLVSNPEKSYQTMQALLEPATYRPLYLALLAFSNQHEPAETCQSIEFALAAWPDEPEWHAFAAEKYQQAGDLITATRHWQQATQLNPENVQYKLSYATNCFEAGEIEQALLAYTQITRLDPENHSAWHRLAETNKNMGKLSEALNCAERACTLDPNDIHSLALSGQIAFELGEKEMAYQKAKAVLAVDPNDIDGILLYAQTMEKMGFAAEALAYIEQSLQRIQAPYQALIQRALLVRQVHGSNQALPYFQELAHVFSDKNEVLSPYSEILIETGQLELGETMAQASLQIDPNQPKIHLLLGRLQRFKGQLDQAIFHLCESIKQSPNQIEPYLELGRAYHDRREHALAIKTYRQATRISPEDPRPYYHASLALKECKDYVAAETMLRYAARLAPNDLNIRRQLGAIIALNLVHNPHEVSIKQ
jgi:tetratricopeptide (TPR) repeat protein